VVTPLHVTPHPYLCLLRLPKGPSRSHLFGATTRSKWVNMTVHLEVPATRMALSAAGNVYDERVKRGQTSLEASIVESLHECSNQIALAALVQLLRRI
jgi:hypothetical protein